MDALSHTAAPVCEPVVAGDFLVSLAVALVVVSMQAAQVVAHLDRNCRQVAASRLAVHVARAWAYALWCTADSASGHRLEKKQESALHPKSAETPPAVMEVFCDPTGSCFSAIVER